MSNACSAARRGAGAFMILLPLLIPRSATAQAAPPPFDYDNERMAAFDFFIGTWGAHPDSAAAEAYREVFEWALPGKAVRRIEYRRIDGRLQKVAEMLIGYHYGLQEIRAMGFMRDGVNPFEVAYFGTFEISDGSVAPTLTLFNRAYDPDTSSRLYRERYTALDDHTRELRIDALGASGEWRPFGAFIAVRREPVVAPTGGADAV